MRSIPQQREHQQYCDAKETGRRRAFGCLTVCHLLVVAVHVLIVLHPPVRARWRAVVQGMLDPVVQEHLTYFTKAFSLVGATPGQRLPVSTGAARKMRRRVTRKCSNDEMEACFRRLVKLMFEHCRVGIAFNTISTALAAPRNDLYIRNPADTIEFCMEELSRSVVFDQSQLAWRSQPRYWENPELRPQG